MSSDFLSTTIKQRGEKFDEDHQFYLINNSRGGKLAGISILFLMGLAFWIILSLQYDESERNLITMLLVISFVIFFVLSIFFLVKAKPFKKSGIDYVFLNAYRAYLSLESYEQSGKSENKSPYFEEAKKEMHRIKWEIVTGWKQFTDFNQVIPKLDNEINSFIINIKKLTLALDEKSVPIPIIRSTLLQLMEHFSKETYNINQINTAFEKYKDISLPAKTPEKIKDLFIQKEILKHIMWISLFLGIGIVSGTIVWILGGSRDVQLTVGGAFSSIPTGWYVIELIRNRPKK